MALFKIENKKVGKIKSAKVEKEKDIQTIFEQNLETILNIYFLDTEYPTGFGGRIDTLGVDKDGSPVIIEYKKTQSESIIPQGLSYLRWLKDHSDTFEKLISEKLPKILECPVNWDTPRVICIAENYNVFDLDTADYLKKEVKIELFTYTIYENNILQVEAPNYQRIRIPSTGIMKNVRKEAVDIENEKLQKSYTVEEHLKDIDQNIKSLFFKLRESIKLIDESIKEEPLKKYIAYKLSTNFTDVAIYKSQLKIFLNVKSGQLDDPYNIARDLEKPKHIGHHGNGDYEIKISKEEELEKVFELIKKSYNYNK